MLSGADLDKILVDGYGDAGFNDPGLELEEGNETAAKSARKEQTELSTGSGAGGKAASDATAVHKPYDRKRVLGATPPPPDGTDLEKYELNMVLDQEARKKGYNSIEEYNAYLEKSAPPMDTEKVNAEMNETPLAPGIKKAPAYMPPGAYPGDRTKIGKDYDNSSAAAAPVNEVPSRTDLVGVETVFVKQAEQRFGTRANDGNTVTLRLDGKPEEQTAELGSTSLPWAIDATVRKMKVGDIMDVIGRGEHAFADDEKFQPGQERKWRVEFLSIGGKPLDKFALSTDERVDRANELRLRGNDMFKKGRLLRAFDYYERGSSLMDVLEAEELGMPGKVNSEAAKKNQRIWQCQKPLLLNWALVLMKLHRWEEAERKCTEVLMDIDKLNVKALFRRGQCNVQLRLPEQAKKDLSRAAELDTSIAPEVEREMVMVREMEMEEDKQDRPIAKKLVEGFVQAGDERSLGLAPVGPQAVPDPTSNLYGMLQAQEAAAETSDVSKDDYCRQREAIYNQFIKPACVDDADD